VIHINLFSSTEVFNPRSSHWQHHHHTSYSSLSQLKLRCLSSHTVSFVWKCTDPIPQYSYPCEDGDVDLIKDASISLAAHGQYM
jgi:hypothetical protein